MEQLLKNFGNLLGIPNLVAPAGKLYRLYMDNLGDLDLFHEEGRLLMRLTKPVTILSKDSLLNLLSATHYRYLPPYPMLPCFQKPDRVGLGFIFSEQDATPDRLYHGLEFLTKELRKIFH